MHVGKGNHARRALRAPQQVLPALKLLPSHVHAIHLQDAVVDLDHLAALERLHRFVGRASGNDLRHTHPSADDRVRLEDDADPAVVARHLGVPLYNLHLEQILAPATAKAQKDRLALLLTVQHAHDLGEGLLVHQLAVDLVKPIVFFDVLAAEIRWAALEDLVDAHLAVAERLEDDSEPEPVRSPRPILLPVTVRVFGEDIWQVVREGTLCHMRNGRRGRGQGRLGPWDGPGPKLRPQLRLRHKIGRLHWQELLLLPRRGGRHLLHRRGSAWRIQRRSRRRARCVGPRRGVVWRGRGWLQ